MGERPMVFRTAPPQPALKVSMIISALAVGGPAAKINGFGKLMSRNVLPMLTWISPRLGGFSQMMVMI